MNIYELIANQVSGNWTQVKISPRFSIASFLTLYNLHCVTVGCHLNRYNRFNDWLMSTLFHNQSEMMKTSHSHAGWQSFINITTIRARWQSRFINHQSCHVTLYCCDVTVRPLFTSPFHQLFPFGSTIQRMQLCAVKGSASGFCFDVGSRDGFHVCWWHTPFQYFVNSFSYQ